MLEFVSGRGRAPELYRDLTTDPPGWGIRGTFLEAEVVLEAGTRSYITTPRPFDVPLLIGEGAITIGNDTMVER